MKCSSPKRIVIRYGNTLYSIYVPCGKCYACQCQSRAEWALRCSYELQETHKKKGGLIFVTLTYDNRYLPHTCNENTFKHLVNVEMLKRESGRRWNFARLDPSHASQIMAAAQKFLKQRTDKQKLFRFFLSAEYGDETNRPHYHILIFSPVDWRVSDYNLMFKSIWKYGNVDIEVPDSDAAVINYLAKHQVKSCAGSKEQQKESPIFKRTSRYRGGIGYSMRNDITLRHRFFNDD